MARTAGWETIAGVSVKSIPAETEAGVPNRVNAMKRVVKAVRDAIPGWQQHTEVQANPKMQKHPTRIPQISLGDCKAFLRIFEATVRKSNCAMCVARVMTLSLTTWVCTARGDCARRSSSRSARRQWLGQRRKRLNHSYWL